MYQQLKSALSHIRTFIWSHVKTSTLKSSSKMPSVNSAEWKKSLPLYQLQKQKNDLDHVRSLLKMAHFSRQILICLKMLFSCSLGGLHPSGGTGHLSTTCTRVDIITSYWFYLNRISWKRISAVNTEKRQIIQQMTQHGWVAPKMERPSMRRKLHRHSWSTDEVILRDWRWPVALWEQSKSPPLWWRFTSTARHTCKSNQ